MLATNRIATICFHGIGTPERELEPGEERFWIEPAMYEEILDVIAAHPRPVDLTFDDANASDFVYGLPGLLRRNMRAEFFVIGGRLGQPGSLSPDEVRELRDAGMVIGNHGLRHLPWREVPTLDELEEEVGESARIIERETGIRPVNAACPRGSYDRRVLNLLRRHGYHRVYSVDEGTSRAGSWVRSRYSVIHSDTAESIRRRLDDPDGPWPDRMRRGAAQTVKRWR
ncbi:polysaccharide deacetylase family protein [Aldersonia sp. NBC_00410]|uniref:polysaccharide deacetylase family protein n=1 Tax=Aldersonia sp. NBC_00410 TaxID=2975954 RepID=UPI00225840C0|nr:polysaccharide deacetylase family protein [Aldersonia sp. NBC_00410]MCX5041679.1 polysaccharide deacetylase family protein [Aldersonia sp. NBC_00410]